MKNAGFRALNKSEKSGGNIHFRKVFLTFMLVSLIVLSSIEYVSASESLNYYNNSGEWKWVTESTQYEPPNGWRDRPYVESHKEGYIRAVLDIEDNRGNVIYQIKTREVVREEGVTYRARDEFPESGYYPFYITVILEKYVEPNTDPILAISLPTENSYFL